MLSLAILTTNQALCSDLEMLARECGIFAPIHPISPIPTIPEVLRTLRTQNPDVILLDASEWDAVSMLAARIKEAHLKGVVVGCGVQWTRGETIEMEGMDILDLVSTPLSPAQLEARVYDGLHRVSPNNHPNLLAFMPAKAGSGASTVAMNTAVALANGADGGPKKVLLIEADRRSGVFSILLNLKDQSGLPEALKAAGELTSLEWNRYVVTVSGVHLLAANPARRALHSWADYYQLLHFARDRYDYIIVDLPEVVNSATTELVRSARAIFITCTPEVPSLAMAGLRAAELDSSEIPRDKVKMLVNRWERGGLSTDEIERILGAPIFATLPNNYRDVKKSIIEGRPLDPSSSLARSCGDLGKKISTLGQTAPTASRFSLLRKWSAITA